MARIRSIKPEFWTSEQIVECSTSARLLFVGLWTFADDNGVIPRRVRSIKMQVFPGDEFSLSQIDGWLQELERGGLIQRFTDLGEDYILVTGWSRHQKIDKPSYKHPCPEKFDNRKPDVRRAFYERSSNASPRIGVDRSGGESTGGEKAQPPVDEKSESKPVITKTELQETPPDGPAALTEADVMQFVVDFNTLAERHPGRLTRYGQVTLNRFSRDALESRIAAGTWQTDWQAFVQALAAGRVTSSGVTMKKLLEGDILDAVAAAERHSQPKKARRRRKPVQATSERPYAAIDGQELLVQKESTERYIAMQEAKTDLPAEKLLLLNEAHAKLAKLQAEAELRKDEQQAAQAGTGAT